MTRERLYRWNAFVLLVGACLLAPLGAVFAVIGIALAFKLLPSIPAIVLSFCSTAAFLVGLVPPAGYFRVMNETGGSPDRSSLCKQSILFNGATFILCLMMPWSLASLPPGDWSEMAQCIAASQQPTEQSLPIAALSTVGGISPTIDEHR